MNNLSFSFSLVDFLAYVFPGIVIILAIFIITLFIPQCKEVISNIEITWVIGLIGIAIAYLFGMLSSNVFFLLGFEKRRFVKGTDIENPLSNPLLEDFRNDIRSAYNQLFGECNTWSRKQYYLIRSVVREQAPQSAEYANRQNSLRHMRKNSIIPVWFWGGVGISAGIKMFFMEFKGDVLAGISIIIISFILTWFLTYVLLEGAARNREFEVRDYCLAFLHLNKLGRLVPGEVNSGTED